MAVAAYASLVSLMQVLDNVQHPARRHRLHTDKEQIQSLHEKVMLLQEFLEVHSQRKSQEMEDLARQITVAVHEADDVIDLHVVDQLREESQDKRHHMTALSSFCRDLDTVIGKIETITKELMMIKEEWGDDDVQEQMPVVSAPANSTTLPCNGKKNTMVGFDQHLLRVMDELTKGESNLHILPIVGMGGIGLDDLNRFFPNNRNGSRIIMTTRLKDLVGSLGRLQPYLMNFLDEDKSWNLLCERIFGEEGCPNSELERIGKDNVKGCGGLPLAIIVIGGLLANSNMRPGYWESIAKNVKTFANSDDNNGCLKILSLSYNNLPFNLKSCFLYMRVFPEDAKISVSELIKLWIIEGDLCVIEFEKQHFIRVPKRQYINNVRWNSEMCIVCHGRCRGKHSSASNDTGLVCQTCESMYSDLTELRWIKVIGQPSEKFLQHTKLQDIYILAFPDSDHTPNEYEFVSPSTLDLLWNLRYLFILLINNGEPIVLPSKIWEMPQLRCIDVRNVILPNPVDIQDSIVLENLDELSFVYEFKCTKEVLERIPNLKILSLRYYNYAKD
ncbi:UNVERIFIED_CONTAM: Disease resistance RPP8-like protein 3 [Sesamum calycinum]|uniref:Disease resistance RPP8-like protein 3 n=1 Tax=Sesamum calycinum TaxID=2727403 RepID=A0AAW2NDG6_9LAMI